MPGGSTTMSEFKNNMVKRMLDVRLARLRDKITPKRKTMTIEERVKVANLEKPIIERPVGDTLIPILPQYPERGTIAHCKHLGWGSVHSFLGDYAKYAFIAKDRMSGCDLIINSNGVLQVHAGVTFGSEYNIPGSLCT